jgi:hypothetical protein
VITVPWSRRKWLAFRPELARGVLAVALRQIFGWLEAEALVEHGLGGARCGAVTAEQRFGSSLALNLHFHCLVPDGVFARDAAGEVRFHRVRPHRSDLEALVERIGAAAEAWLARHGTDEEPDPDDAQAALVAAAVEGRTAAGPRAGAPTRRTRDPGQARDEGLGHGVSFEGYGLHAGTWITGDDREGLKRLVGYLLRPPLAKGRLDALPDGQIRWTMRKPWRDGTTSFVFSPLELVQRLAAFVVPTGVHTVHFHGVFAPNAAWRSEVVLDPEEARRHREALEELREQQLMRKRARRARRRMANPWCPWSALLERVFGTGGTRCPRCGRGMSVRAIVIGRPATTRILAGLRRSARGPPSSAPSP